MSFCSEAAYAGVVGSGARTNAGASRGRPDGRAATAGFAGAESPLRFAVRGSRSPAPR
jgi:hypothetical protein